VLAGVYITVGRFVVDRYQRGRTYYGVTDQRAIIKTSGGIKSLSLRNLGELSLKEAADGSGTIAFASGDSRYAMFAGSGWPGMGKYLPPRFEMIEGARQVYTQLRDSQRTADRLGAH
jgi:hypothetical protein